MSPIAIPGAMLASTVISRLDPSLNAVSSFASKLSDPIKVGSNASFLEAKPVVDVTRSMPISRTSFKRPLTMGETSHPECLSKT